MKRILCRGEGFTLIELMIVILIIAILVAIAIPVYLATQNNAKTRACQANLRTIDGAIQVYNSSAGVYPGAGAGGMASVTSFLKTAPCCPSDKITAYQITAANAASCCKDGGHTY